MQSDSWHYYMVQIICNDYMSNTRWWYSKTGMTFINHMITKDIYLELKKLPLGISGVEKMFWEMLEKSKRLQILRKKLKTQI